MDLDNFVSESPPTPVSKELKQSEVVLFDVMDGEREEDPTEVLIGDEKVEMASKGKTKIFYNDEWQCQVKDASASDTGNSTSVAGSVDSVDPLKCSTSGSINSNNPNSPNSDLLYHDENEYLDDCVDDVSDYDDNDDYLYEDDYLTMQSQFDNVDIPAGVEASLPWLKNSVPSENITSSSSNSIISDLAESKRKATILDLADTKRKATIPSIGDCKLMTACASSSMALVESSSTGAEEVDKVMQRFQCFKQFDTVDDFSDHHYLDLGFSEQQPPKNWAKRIQEEWSILDKGLPDTIFVRAYEARMDLLRAVIIGPSGTPYHDGLFVFDCLFPCKYPDEPPMVYYYSGGLRLNPNLYECGKVCLSLLGTWSGQQTEMWIPGKSTMLQVLVSIQALILNAKPFFNEPGYESSFTGEEGGRRSKKYNEDVFIKSLKTMVYILRRPPKHFEEFVAGHFRKRARDILIACKAYTEGATVGSVEVKDGVQSVDSTEKSASGTFRTTVGRIMSLLVMNFATNGSTDCDQFLTSSKT